MKAVLINNYGGLDVLSVGEINKSLPQPGQVLVEVRAASLNPFDSKLREGKFRDFIPLKLPAVIGGDLAGVIVGKGKNVDGFKVGDKVFGQAAAVAGNSGAFAEYAATASNQITLMPDNLSFEEAASLPLVGVSALQALDEHLSLKAGQMIFIHGGTGSIGVIAIQIAKHLGAYVAASSRGPAEEYLTELGVDVIINTELEDFADQLHDYDAVFDTVGGDDFDKALDILKDGGRAVSMSSQADGEKDAARNIIAITQSTKVNTQKLDKLRELVEKGVVKPQIGEVFPLDQARQAFEARESGSIRGKVVLGVGG